MGKQIRPWQSVPGDLFLVKCLFSSPPPPPSPWNFFISFDHFLWFPRSLPSVPLVSNYEEPCQLGERGLTDHHLQSKGDGGFHLQCTLASKLCFRRGQIYHSFGGWGSFVNKVSHSNKLIVSWKYQDPSQSVMIQPVQHYESLRDESWYSDLLFLRQPQVSFPRTTTHAQKITQC